MRVRGPFSEMSFICLAMADVETRLDGLKPYFLECGWSAEIESKGFLGSVEFGMLAMA